MNITLNPEQQSAVDHVAGPCLVTATPGSGKTRTLTQRAINLIKQHNVQPSNILCLTFTNKAANEMRERIAESLGEAVTSKVWISTFHHFCLGVLKKYTAEAGLSPGFSIYDDKDQKELIQKIVRMREYDDFTPKRVSFVARSINDFREKLHKLEDCLAGHDHQETEIIREYLQLLDEFNAVDFSGILYRAWQLVQGHTHIVDMLNSRFKYVMIDEGQDTNQIQYVLVKKICQHQNLFVVGDFAQAIFSFRGAQPENLNLLKKDFPNINEITLPRNYRSTKQILEIAERLIRFNKGMEHVTLISECGDGKSPRLIKCFDPTDEGNRVAQQMLQLKKSYDWKDITVLYRTNPQSQALEMSLRKAHIPYKIHGGFSFFDRREIKTTLAYLAFLTNPSDTISFSRAISEPSRKVADTTIGKIERLCQLQKISILEACPLVENMPKVQAAAKENLRKFADITNKYRSKVDTPIDEIAMNYLRETGYYDFMKKESETDDVAKKRIENIDQLLLNLSEFVKQKPTATLGDYLHNVELLTTDERDDSENHVTLMTIHSSKGLEFPVVFIVGCENNIIPHYMSLQEGNTEEERRLMYVGITRAKSELFMSYCQYRGSMSYSTSAKDKKRPVSPSMFLTECLGKNIE